MTTQPTASIINHFSSIPDPRIQHRKPHKLQNIFFIAIYAVVCGVNDWVSVESCCNTKKNGLAKHSI
jgi:hypothetical protein